MRRVVLLLAVALSLGACSTDPEGTRLLMRMETGQAQHSPGSCTVDRIPPFRIERDGTLMVFTDVWTDDRLSIIWPFGFAAWLEFDVAVLYARDGTVVGREGDILENIGAQDVDGGAYRVYCVGIRNY